MHFGPEDDAGVSSQHSNTQSPAPGVAAEASEILPILEQLVAALASQDEEGLIEHAAPMIAARQLIGKLKTQAPAERWVSFKEKMPPEDPALDNPDVTVVRRVLVTNNLSARDRMGRMSHIWLAMPLESSDGTIVAFTEADTKIHGLTHWLDPLPSLTSRAPAPGMAGGVVPASVESSLWTIKEWALLHLGPMHNITIAANSAHAQVAAPRPSPAPQAAGADDTARYQLIRAGNLYAKHRPVYEAIVEGFTGPELDSAIDAAITASGRDAS